MSKIVECVPNFSEGRDRKIIDAIADAMRAVPGVTLLDVDPGASTNRTVYTLVGAPEDAIEGALAGAKVAYQLIDMTKHKGEHKRLGAMDVCPFIPVQGVTMEDCVYCARVLAERLAAMLNVPVYLYGFAAHQEYRKTVPQIRAGEYEAIKDRILEPQWKPDFGPAEFVPRWGATMAGARKFLIAYNVNMLSTKEQAHRIALDIRENGRNKGEPGKFKGVQAMGWWLEEDNMAQVTINILDYEITPIHEVYEAVLEGAVELNLPVTGSQVVGLVPLNSILAGRRLLYQEGELVHLRRRPESTLGHQQARPEQFGPVCAQGANH
ncbi:Formimidoyltransferase-cyclodeaminase [Halotydeus destructor]|nr:Formimidoyltransferase-cyclodeaminase [Halotydeus destructor]